MNVCLGRCSDFEGGRRRTPTIHGRKDGEKIRAVLLSEMIDPPEGERSQGGQKKNKT